MNTTHFQSPNEIRIQFTRAMSDMYQLEVPMYKNLLSLTDDINQQHIHHSTTLTAENAQLLNVEHHGAIRLGHPSELFVIRRLFNVMGMIPVDYYDLSVAGIPVHSTAFRALNKSDIQISPFRVFCSLLRLDLINDKSLKAQVSDILGKRQFFPKNLLKLIQLSEEQGGLTQNEADSFIKNALEVFRWHQNATVDKQTYEKLKHAHSLIADIVSFKGPHINHLTPKVLNIDACQTQFSKNNITAKTIVEGPPKRNCPILLRQTSFIAVAEEVNFTNGEFGFHSARFGEVEQRGIALTPKGRELYDRLLSQAKNDNTEIEYTIRLKNAFKEFPDTYDEIRQHALGYFHYSVNKNNENSNIRSSDLESLINEETICVTPIIYEDFLPVSAAGIFTSNLSSKPTHTLDSKNASIQKNNINRRCFEDALGVTVKNSFELYAAVQLASLNKVSETLKLKLKVN